MDQNQNQERRRGHFHRGRRGSDRRGPERRAPQHAAAERQRGDHVEVEQIMRDIRSKIAHRQGIDLSNEQIQDLAARRLESILDPRAMKPSLLDSLRKSAAAVNTVPRDTLAKEPVYTFEDTTIYDSPRGLLRLMRRLLNPLLKLFFNPNPLIRALHLQARLNVEAASREAERNERQTEWNALHYEIVQRVVTEMSRLSLEVQALSLRIESLNAKIDFNDRRVRGLEGTLRRSRPAGRQPEGIAAPSVPEADATPGEPPADPAQAEGARRRRRRRRGRRSAGPLGEATAGPRPAPSTPEGPESQTANDSPAENVLVESGHAGLEDSSPPVVAVMPAPPAPEEVPPVETRERDRLDPSIDPDSTEQ
jgi:hypothetical protein